jgi:hypothetical protein
VSGDDVGIGADVSIVEAGFVSKLLDDCLGMPDVMLRLAITVIGPDE